MKKIILLESLAILGLFIVGCNHPAEPKKTTPPATYTVTFNANGGSGTMAPQTFIEGVPQALSQNTFTHTDETKGVSHWNTQTDGKGTNYTNFEVITMTQDITLYAIWENYTPLSHFTIENGVIIRYNKNSIEVHIPPSIIGIGDYAFFSSEIQSITIPNSVTFIGYRAFAGSYSLQSLIIPDSITSIGDGAFMYCINLHSITVESNSAYFEVEDGILYTKNKTELIRYPTSKQEASFSIPDGVSIINEAAFADCRSLNNITLPNSLTIIEDEAFANCTNLKSLTIPDGVNIIGNGAFLHCNKLDSITVKSGNTYFEVEDNILYTKGKDKLILYPPGKKDKEFPIPESVISIGHAAFHNRDIIEVITLGNKVTSIEDLAFADCEKLKSITIPNTLTSIGRNAFRSCNLTSIIIPDNVKNIAKDAFEASGLETVYTNYTKNVDGSSGGDRPYPVGWLRSENYSDPFFDAEWKPIPTS